MKAKIVRGSGFRGVLDYAHKSQSTHICGNMSGTNPKDLAKEFGVARQMREDVDKPVWHCSLALPVGERISDEKWAKIAEKFMEEMEFTSLNQYTVLKHEDTDKQHIHIIANRIGLDGNLWYGKMEALKAINITQKLEKEFDLTITAGLENRTGKKSLTKGEIEMTIRTGEAPAKQILQNTIDTALSSKQSIFAFIEKLENAGIKAIPNVAKTGKMNGFSFEIDGIYFKGSQLGKKYSWNELIKKGVIYEQDRDSKKLIERAEQAKATSDIEPSGIATIESEAVGENSPGAEQNSSNDRGIGAKSVAIGTGIESVDRTFNSDNEDSNKRFELDTHAVSRSDRASESRNIEPEKIVNLESVHSVISDGNNAWSGVGAVVSDLNATSASSQLKPDHQAKIRAWDAQSSALNAPAYRITCMSRIDGKASFNLGKNKDGSEKLFTKQEVEKKIGELRAKNAQGYDIYLTPMDENYHYVVIDDIKSENIQTVKEKYQPCLVQSSSDDNFQAIIKVSKSDHKEEQKIANKLVVKLNERFGDPKFSGVVHPFRMAGFSNKKANRNNFITRVVDGFSGLVATVFDSFLNRLREAKPVLTTVTKEKSDFEAGFSNDEVSDLEKKFNFSYKKITGLVEKNKWTFDASVVDFNVAKDLLKIMHSRDVLEAMKYSPDIQERHKDVDTYLKNTIKNALGGGSNGYKL